MGRRELTLPRSFYDRPVLEVARDLLGKVVAHAGVAVRLTEVEAYAGRRDPASHAYRGPTPRTATMFGPAGHAYVYFTYGMHHCVNVVCGHGPGEAAAVLLRAGEVLCGGGLARARRPAAVREADLARGPARLAQALALDRSLDGADVTDPAGPLRLRAGPVVAAGRVRVGPRVGVAAAAEAPWRLWIDGDPTVSAYRPAVPRRRAAGP